MGLLSMTGDARELLIRITALNAAVQSQGTATGHPVEKTVERAREFEPYLRGEDDG